MAPRKEKSEKAPGDQGASLILDYLRKQNAGILRRIQPMQLKRSKKCMSETRSQEDRLVRFSTFRASTIKHRRSTNERKGDQEQFLGKQTVYHALQDPSDVASPEEIAAIDREIETTREQIGAGRATERLLKANLATLNATLSTEDLCVAITALEVEREAILERLVPLRSGSVKPLSLEEKTHVDHAWTEWQKKWNVRRKIAMEVWAHVTEVLPEGTTKEELWESLGLELDP
ncbi:hypothetical protein MMC16_001333 [Acarospora aff. strigata]|nr:hypothetical protein [Acarospora aff. strigata]